MSVYKPTKSCFFHYDFQWKGKRFSGSTGVGTRRKAEAVERRVREQAAVGALNSGDVLTFDCAARRWWNEVGLHRASARQLEHRLEIALRLIGPQTPLTEITTARIAKATQKRRGEGYTRAPGEKARRYSLANATVNADVVKPVRQVLSRARTTWEVKGIPEIDWKALLLPEAPAEIRLYSDKQQADWLAACDETSRFPLQLLLTYGLRFGELFFPPGALVVTNERPHLVLNKRKRGALLLPLTAADARSIAARVRRASAAGLSTIWFEETARGELAPLAYAALQSRLRVAAKRAGLTMPRVIHGARHHAGTTMLAQTNNLKMTQQLLGHADIKSTTRYAHALTEQLRDALESRNSPELPGTPAEFMPQKQRRRRK